MGLHNVEIYVSGNLYDGASWFEDQEDAVSFVNAWADGHTWQPDRTYIDSRGIVTCSGWLRADTPDEYGDVTYRNYRAALTYYPTYAFCECGEAYDTQHADHCDSCELAIAEYADREEVACSLCGDTGVVPYGYPAEGFPCGCLAGERCADSFDR